MNISLKRFAIFIHDITWVPLAVYLAYLLRFNLGSIPSDNYLGAYQLFAAAILFHSVSFWFFACYRGVWRFASLPDIVRLLKAIATGSVLTGATLFLYSRFNGIPRSTIVLYPILLFLGVVSSRVIYRLINTRHITLERVGRERALIVGAGRAGEMLIRDLLDHGQFMPVVILDDDRAKIGTDLHGIRVAGELEKLPDIISAYEIEMVLIAIPSAPRHVMDDVVRQCAEAGVKSRTLPSLLELADGRVEVSRLRPVTVEDLLGREPVKLDDLAIDAYLENKTVVVTGGGGSIGSELCRQVLSHSPRRLIILENSEYNLYRIEKELAESKGKIALISALIDVRRKDFVENLFAKFRPEVVFHAAAYKHVPMIEGNVIAGIHNNVLGTRIVADASIKYGVSRFVLVSTDKTVNPTNIMGATKRVAEIYCQTLNENSDTNFITTRFGNVLDSAGSVVPLFKQQIQAGGPVTVTHPDITRYFMTIPEAASLILQAGAMGKGGEIFVLDMGNPVKILDLAENLIRLSGLQPGRDIKIEFIGLRPGEKMHEELFYSKEELVGTKHPKLMLANCATCVWGQVETELRILEQVASGFDEDAAIASISRLVPEFRRYVPSVDAGAEKPGSGDSGLRVVK